MIFVWVLFAFAFLVPFFDGMYRELKGYPPDPNIPNNSEQDKKQAAQMKKATDILEKNRTDSWTDPNYFKK